jgi:predicted ester cyclase
VVARVTYSGTHRREFMGLPATGKQVRFSGINIFWLKGGKVVEQWSQSDQLSMLQQMGAIPAQP